MKWIVRIALVVVVVVIVIGAGLYFYADAGAKRAIERGGRYATGVDTSVESVRLGLFTGEAGLRRLEIANPPGFERDYFLKLGEADLAVGLRSLLSDTVHVPRIHLTDIDLNLERTGEKPNYQIILDNLERLSSGETQGKPQQWVVDDLQVRNIHVIATFKGLAADAQTIELTLPQIVLTDVKSDSLAELQGQVLKQILRAVIQQSATQLPGMMRAELTAGVARVGALGESTLKQVSEATAVVGDLGGKAGDTAQKAADKLKDVTGEAGKAIDDVTKGLRDVLKGGDKQAEPADQPNQ